MSENRITLHVVMTGEHSRSTRRSTRLPSERILHAIARDKEVDPTELAPLFDAIDPEFLDELIRSARSPPAAAVSVSFEYEGYCVIISGDDTLQLFSLGDESADVTTSSIVPSSRGTSD